MRRILLASSLVAILAMSGCGSRGSAPELVNKQEDIVTKSVNLDTLNHSIATDEDFTTLTLDGDPGSTLFVNGEKVGTFPDSGTLEVTLGIKEAGNYTYEVVSKAPDGSVSDTVVIEVVKSEKSASLGTVTTGGEASSLTVSQDGTIFIAEKNSGVEIISIGYSDRVSSDLLSTIDSINAHNVILSDDEKTLYVEDDKGEYHILDISDLTHPQEREVIKELDKSVSIVSEDGTMRYRISYCGLIGEDVSNPSDIVRKFIIKDREIKDAVLVDNDTKVLVAHGLDGLELFDLADIEHPLLIATKNLNANTTGLSLLKKDGVLFVANGDSGVQIFKLDILLNEMMH